MIFVEENNKINKYEIVFDREKILRLRIQIINNCSEIEHKEMVDDYGPDDNDWLRIRNLEKKEFVKTRECFEESVNLYRYVYDEYHYPYLVTLIDKLLSGEYWDGMFTYNKREILTAKEKLDIFSKKMIEEDKLTDLSSINELKRLVNLSKRNENQISIKEYYNVLNDEVTLKLIDSIDIEEVTRVRNFFSEEMTKYKVKEKWLEKAHENEIN